MHAFVIAGTHSGVGKTTVTQELHAALRKRVLAVQPFKVGPDLIDPGHHTAVAGVPSRNLDGWMLSRKYNQDTFRHNTQGHDVGVMGVFDGYDGKSEAGSTAEMAQVAGYPRCGCIGHCPKCCRVDPGFSKFRSGSRCCWSNF